MKKICLFLVILISLFQHKACSQTDPFPEIAANAQPSIGTVEVTSFYTHEAYEPDFATRAWEGFFEEKVNEETTQRKYITSEGTGVVIDDSGLILTNAHVVTNGDSILFSISGGKRVPLKLIGVNEKEDLALLKADAKHVLKAVKLGDSDGMKQGETVMAIGNPNGYRYTVSRGTISAKERELEISGAKYAFIQLDMALNPGNSGGPVFNQKGEMIGLVTLGDPYAQGIGFAIPINKIKKLLPELKNPVAEKNDLRLFFKRFEFVPKEKKTETKESLIMASQISVDSKTYRTGLRDEDIIRRINGKEIRTLTDLIEIGEQIKPGERILIYLERDHRMFFTYLEAKS